MTLSSKLPPWPYGLLALFFLCKGFPTWGQDLPEFLPQVGHTGAVQSMSFSPDGEMLASGSDDTTIKLWDLETGKIRRTLKGHESRVLAVQFSSDRTLLASGDMQGIVILWNVSDGRLLHQLQGPQLRTSSLSFSSGDRWLASGGGDGTVRLWDTGTGALIHTLEGYGGEISSLAFSPSSAVLASAGKDATVRLWNVESGQSSAILRGHHAPIRSLEISTDGRVLASADADNTVKLWELVEETALLHTLEAGCDSVQSVGLSPGAQTLLAGCLDGTFESWDVATGKLQQSHRIGISEVRTVSISENLEVLAFSRDDRTIELWNVATRMLRHTLSGYTDYIRSVSFSPDGRILASSNLENEVKLWDVSRGTLLSSLQGHSSSIRAISFSSDGKVLASGSGDRSIKFWDVKTGGLVSSFKAGDTSIRTISLSSDRQTLAIGGRGHKVRLWSVEEEALLLSLAGHEADIESVAFSPDDKLLASGSQDRRIKLWDVRRGHLERTFEAHKAPVVSVSFSSDGRILASGSVDRTVNLWSVDHGHLLHTLRGHQAPVVSVSFSSDGTTLASGGWDGSVKLWSVETGEPIRDLQGHEGYVLSVSFSSTGKLLVSSGADGFRYWSKAGDPLAVTYAIGQNDYLTYTPEGYYVASPGGAEKAVWWINGEIYTVEQYAQIFNKPRNVERKLAGLDVAKPAIRLEAASPPDLRWANPFHTIDQEEAEIILSYRGSSDIAHLFATFNNHPLDIELGEQEDSQKIKISLPLVRRHNHLVAYAVDKQGLESKPLIIEFEYLGAKLPEISFSQESPRFVDHEDFRLKFEVRLTSEPSIVTLNGVIQTSPQGRDSRDGYIVLAYDIPVVLKPQKNLFTVRVATPEGALSEEVFSVSLNPKPETWVAAIGISQYSDPEIPPLLYAHQDAQKVYEFYRDDVGIEEDHLFLLLDQEATLEKINELLGIKLPKWADENDIVVIYFAGHGIHEQEEELPQTEAYLVPSNGKLSQLFTKALSMRYLQEIFNRINAHRVILIADTCFSGKIGSRRIFNNKRKRKSSTTFLPHLVEAGEKRIILAAAHPDEVAYESPDLGHGVFTYYLLEGLRGKAETNGDREIDLFEIRQYTRDNVLKKTFQTQRPFFNWDPNEPFVLRRLPQ